MNNTLSIDKEAFDIVLADVKNFSFFDDSLEAFSSLQDTMSTINMKAAAFQTYYTAFTQIIFRMNEYYELVQKNCEAIENAITEYQQLDLNNSVSVTNSAK